MGARPDSSDHVAPPLLPRSHRSNPPEPPEQRHTRTECTGSLGGLTSCKSQIQTKRVHQTSTAGKTKKNPGHCLRERKSDPSRVTVLTAQNNKGLKRKNTRRFQPFISTSKQHGLPRCPPLDPPAETERLPPTTTRFPTSTVFVVVCQGAGTRAVGSASICSMSTGSPAPVGTWGAEEQANWVRQGTKQAEKWKIWGSNEARQMPIYIYVGVCVCIHTISGDPGKPPQRVTNSKDGKTWFHNIVVTRILRGYQFP